MPIAKVINGAIVKYPYSLADLRADYPDTCFMSPLVGAALGAFGVVDVQSAMQPAPNSGYRVAEAAPALIAGVWTQQWAQVALTAEELAAVAEAQRRADIETAIASDSQLNQFKAMSNAELSSWFDTNITTVSARDALMKRMFRVMVRRVL